MIQRIFYSKYNVINIIILLIPLSYIAGNLVLNLNILILTLSSLILFFKEIFRIQLNKIDKLILLFFVYTILNGFFNNFFNFNFSNATDQNVVLNKSLLYLRYLLLYFVFRFLVEKNFINYKLLFWSFGLASLFVSIDVIIQNFFGKDIFGFEGGNRRLGGPFGAEYIAGAFIQKFFIFLIFAILFFYKTEKKWLFNFLIFIVFILSAMGILFSGNRIPLFLFVITVGLIFIYEKKIRHVLIILLIVFITAFSYLIKTKQDIYYSYIRFAHKSIQIVDYVKERVKTDKVDILNPHIKEIESGILTWQQNKIFGGGIKSFYFNCTKINKFMMENYLKSCNSHPHNYYLEILGILGLVGFVLIITLFAVVTIKALKFIHFSEDAFEKKKFIIPFFIVFIVEIFPLKTTGSFFTTTTSNFLFIILAFVVGLIQSNILKKNYEKK